MYIRNLVKIDGILRSVSSDSEREEGLDYDNSTIISIEQNDGGNLIANLKKKNSTLMGKSYIKPISNIESDVNVLEKIFLSKNVIDKTLNELRNMRLEDI